MVNFGYTLGTKEAKKKKYEPAASEIMKMMKNIEKKKK